MWITPKEDWTAVDYFNLSDYDRIRGNLQYLRNMAVSLYANFELHGLGEKSVSDLPFAEFFNEVEAGLQRLADQSFRHPDFTARKEWHENMPTWSWEDLNRIEGALQSLYGYLKSQSDSKTTIAFILGGGRFAERF